MATKKGGRPRKADEDKWAAPTPLRLDLDTLAAVESYRERERFATRSEAMRRLIRQSLKVEGLLE